MASASISAWTNVPQLQVTAAKPGVVNFELDVQKEHTVSSNLDIYFADAYKLNSIRTA